MSRPTSGGEFGWGLREATAMAAADHKESTTAMEFSRRLGATALASIAALLLIVAFGLAASPQAHGAYGDDFGVAPINDGPGPALEVAVLPGDRAFWAGACTTAEAPAPGGAVAEPGIGTRQNTIMVPNTDGRVSVPAPVTPRHCVDWGTPFWRLGLDPLAPFDLWTDIPAWRLAAEARAGAHPDGSATITMARQADGQAAGGLDNIVVDLPPGFVANPNAVPKCTAEQFAIKPPACPPESQVGMLNLFIRGVDGVGGSNLSGTDDKVHPLWNIEPRRGRAGEIGFAYASGEGAVTVRLEGKVRSGSDNGVTAFVGQIPAALPVIAQTATLWGIPWEASNDLWRAPQNLQTNDPVCVQPGSLGPHYLPPGGLTPGCQRPYRPEWGPIVPFLSNETDCNSGPVTRLSMDSYQHPGGFNVRGEPGMLPFPQVEDENAPDNTAENPTFWETAASPSPAVTDCASLGFAPDIDFAATTDAADGPSGLDVELAVGQNNVARDNDGAPLQIPGPSASAGEVEDYVEAATDYFRSDAGRATAHLKDSVVTLPAGVSVNPSAATGLQACPDAVIGVRDASQSPPLFDTRDPSDGLDGDDCPDGSKIGTVRVDTALLDQPLTGEVILGEPRSTDPQSGEMFRVYLVVRNKERGLLVKIYGTAIADRSTGQLTATFKNNPELPFDNLSLQFKQGPNGLYAMPQRCGTPAWSASFTPWSSVGAPVPVADRPDSGQFAVGSNCGFGFVPSLGAGMDTQAARANGTFSFRFARRDGEQWLRGLTAKLPSGLLASVKGLPLCSNAQADTGSCPAASKIGIVDAKAGSGDPFVLEEKGEVFLTEGYKGGAYGLAVKVRPVAGPFRGQMELSPIIVRQAIHVDPITAQVTAVSDPFPLIHHGVPLRVREVTVLVNRGGFMLNPSDCDPSQVGAELVSAEGATHNATNPFNTAGCGELAFKPNLTLALSGRKQITTGKHPGIKAQVTQQGIGEAGIEKAEVRLPKSLALDVNNAQALCEYTDGTKPDLENHCPKGSIVGRARATSPLLNDPLVGNVYFVKNIRKDPKTGNEIRTLPMIIVALRGEIAVNLKGESDTTKSGKLVSTFASVPDAPVSKFNLNIAGGKNGILAVTRTRRAKINLCARPNSHIAESDMDGHNGRRHDTDIRMKTPCTKKQVKAAKRQAKRATARR